MRATRNRRRGQRSLGILVVPVLVLLAATAALRAEAPKTDWVWATAYALPKETTSDESGYFSIIEGLAQPGKAGPLFIGTAKYGSNAYLVEFNPDSKQMRVVVEAQKEIGTTASGFAAQSKFHTRNNLGASGKIYIGTKQGYAKDGEKWEDYPGGYPMVYDPKSGKTRVYPIAIPHHGIISIAPDESRGVAYISTCSDQRPESSHFMILDLETGKYQDLIESRHMFAFIVIDHRGRAYHPLLGGDVARWDPESKKLERLKQTVDGAPPSADSHLADPDSHPINWDISPDRKTLYALAMNGNQLYAYDLTAEGDTFKGRSLGKLVAAAKAVDCRAMCAGPEGDVWASVSATLPTNETQVRLVSYHPGDKAPVDRGALAIRNPDYTPFTDAAGKALPFHHGVKKTEDGTLVPLYTLGICQSHDGTVTVTNLCPFSILQAKFPNQR